MVQKQEDIRFTNILLTIKSDIYRYRTTQTLYIRSIIKIKSDLHFSKKVVLSDIYNSEELSN